MATNVHITHIYDTAANIKLYADQYQSAILTDAPYSMVYMGASAAKLYHTVSYKYTTVATGVDTFLPIQCSISDKGSSATTILTETSGLIQSRTLADVIDDLGLDGLYAPLTHGVSAGYVGYADTTISSADSPLFVDGTSVGLNTEDPETKFDVNGGASLGYYLGEVAGVQKVFALRADLISAQYDATWFNFYTTPGSVSSRLGIKTKYGTAAESAEWFSLLGNGNLGVSCIAPEAKLEVHGDAWFGIDNYDTEVLTPVTVTRLFANGKSGTYPISSFDFQTVAGTRVLNKLQICSWDSTDGQTSALFTLTGAGYLGLGIASPDTKFQVAEETSSTTSIVNLLKLTHSTTGESGAGFGVSQTFELEDSYQNLVAAGKIICKWETASQADSASLNFHALGMLGSPSNNEAVMSLHKSGLTVTASLGETCSLKLVADSATADTGVYFYNETSLVQSIWFDKSASMLYIADVNTTVTLGNSSATLTVPCAAVNINGDLVFANSGSGLPHAFIYCRTPITQTSAVQNTWYPATHADFADGVLNLITHDGSGTLTVSKTGKYLINYTTMTTGQYITPSKIFEVGISINDAGPADGDGISEIIVVLGDNDDSLSGTAILSVTAGQTIALKFRTESAGSPTVTLSYINLSVVMVGG